MAHPNQPHVRWFYDFVLLWIINTLNLRTKMIDDDSYWFLICFIGNTKIL